MTTHLRFGSILAMALLLMPGLAGCGKSSPATTSSSPGSSVTKPALTKVLEGVPDTSFTNLMQLVALKEGLYKKHGIDFQFKIIAGSSVQTFRMSGTPPR